MVTDQEQHHGTKKTYCPPTVQKTTWRRQSKPAYLLMTPCVAMKFKTLWTKTLSKLTLTRLLSGKPNGLWSSTRPNAPPSVPPEADRNLNHHTSSMASNLRMYHQSSTLELRYKKTSNGAITSPPSQTRPTRLSALYAETWKLGTNVQKRPHTRQLSDRSLSMLHLYGIHTPKWTSKHWKRCNAEQRAGLPAAIDKLPALIPSWLTSTGQHSKIEEKKHDWNYSTNSIKAWLPSIPGTYQLRPKTDAVRGKTTPPATTSLAAELNIGKCHSSLGPSLSGMLYRRRSQRPSRWTASSPGSLLSSDFTNPFPPPPLPPPSQIPLVHSPHLITPYFEQNGKWEFWAWHATHYCINTTEPSKKWCWLYKRKKKRRRRESTLR